MSGLLKKKKEFVVGSTEFYYRAGMKKETKTCDRCGAILYFSDDWDWEKQIPICDKCVVKVKGKKKYKLEKKTIDNLRLHIGMSENEIIKRQNELVTHLEKKEVGKR